MPKDRRTALKVISGAVGGAAALGVGAPIIRAVMDPSGKTTVSGSGEEVEVGAYDVLPEDGTPMSVPIVLERPSDGWNRMPPTQVGSVWLSRHEDGVRALSTICPHLGCGVDWDVASKRYLCPCHTTWFAPDGTLLEGPSPRGMDPLETKVVEGRVWVKYEKLLLGIAERVPA